MKKMEEVASGLVDAIGLSQKLNEVIRALNGLKCVEEEQPIYETLNPNDILIISKNEEGLLIAANDGNGRVVLERVKWPKEKEET